MAKNEVINFLLCKKKRRSEERRFPTKR